MAEERPVLSVVTPSYNQADFLEETVESVLRQEGEFHLDYVVVDGGSSDRSPEILRRVAERVEGGLWPVRCRGLRFRWVSERDRGQADALGKGFGLAEGDVWGWLNSDDVYLPGALDAVARFFTSHPDAAVLYGDADYCDAGGAVLGRYPTRSFDPELLAVSNFACQPSTFFRRRAYDAVGGVDVALRYAMDYDLFVRLSRLSPPAYLPTTLSRYRLHGASKTVRPDLLVGNHEEALLVARRHFGWAPLNRVYGCCHASWQTRLPRALRGAPLLAVALALACALPRSLWLNRGVRRADLRLLTLGNLRKMLAGRAEGLLG